MGHTSGACFTVTPARPASRQRKGTALFDVRLPEAKAIAVFAHLAEGCGIRSTSRLTGVNRTTVGRLAHLAGTHAKAVHDEQVAFSPSDRRSPNG